jgi:hypothetical protein
MANPAKESKVRDVAKLDAAPEFRNVAKFEVTGSLIALGERLGINFGAHLSTEARMDRAAANISRAAQAMLAAGVDLLAIRAECEHGSFLALVEERGMSRDAAYRAIAYAQFVATRSPEEMDQLLAISKSKVLELAKADPVVIEQLLSDGSPIDIKETSVREMRQRILELERALTDTKVECKAAEAERDAAHKRLAKAHKPNRADQVPTVIADLRAEAVVAQRSMMKVVEALYPAGVELMGYVGGDAHEWVFPTASMTLAGLIAVHHALGEQIKKWADGFGIQDVTVDPAYGLTDQEVKDVAKAYDQAARHADYEKALREWERSKDRPRAKGRPMGKPEAPGDYVAEA